MDIEKVREIVRLMIDNDLSSVSVRDGNEEITLNRASLHEGFGQDPVPSNGSRVTHPAVEVPAVVAAVGESPVAPKEENLVPIPSPMVGTLYIAPNPEAPSFVEIGTVVSPKSVVCIIEAMKVFNEIRSEVSGTIERILVTNQQAVEYGQPLFMVRPD